jgi:retron-type reverse transcriptase
MGFTSLAHLMDIDWLQEAYRRTRKDGAAGVDGMTAERYEANLKSNLEGLLDRVKAGTYRAPPVRRVHIPKGNSPRIRDRGQRGRSPFWGSPTIGGVRREAAGW